MRNFIKIITIFGMTVFVPFLYSMELEQTTFYSLHLSFLKNNLNSLSGMKHIPIAQMSSMSDLSASGINKNCISLHDSLYSNNSFALGLALIKVLEAPGNTKNKDLLEEISDEVSKGGSETFGHYFKKVSGNQIYIFPSNTPPSVYELIENWVETEQGKNDNLIVATLKGKLNRKEKLSRKLTVWTRNELKIEIPQDIIDLVLLHLSGCNVDKETRHSPKLIKQVIQEFHEEQK